MMDSLATELVEAAFDMALHSRKPASALLHHADRGAQNAGSDTRRKPGAAGVEMSMCRTGNCYDHAVTESFWGRLNAEMVNNRRFAAKEKSRVAVFECIEVFYNSQRIHRIIGSVTPKEFEASRS